MNEPEQVLIEEMKAGREEAFEAFLETCGARLYSFATRICRNSEDARDVIPDTLVATLRSLKDYRGEGRFRAWLFTIAANACRKMKRKGKYEPEKELSLDEFMPSAQGMGHRIEIVDRLQNPDDLLLRAEFRLRVEKAVAELPPPYRVVLMLRDIEQFTTDKSAQAFGLSPEAVKSRLHRARLYVRGQLEHYHWQPGVQTEHSKVDSQ